MVDGATGNDHGAADGRTVSRARVARNWAGSSSIAALTEHALTGGAGIGTIWFHYRNRAMRTLHDPAVRRSLEARLDALRPDAPRRWGKMTPDQMLWHVNQYLPSATGEDTMPAPKGPVPTPPRRVR